jgi:tRNA (guanine-N7-)-methyltransferase
MALVGELAPDEGTLAAGTAKEGVEIHGCSLARRTVAVQPARGQASHRYRIARAFSAMQPNRYEHAPRLPETGEIRLDEVVPGRGPLLLEIGSGRGAFALQYAAQHPDHRVLALEIRRKYAAILAERFAKQGLPNARCYAEDARAVLPRLRPDAAVQFVAIHFPDPWWKKRHAKRLVVGDALVNELARLVAPGGLVLVQTDVDTRADEYLARFAHGPWFANVAPPGEHFVDESPFAPARSNREARALADGLPIYRLVLRRTEQPFIPRVASSEA